MAEITGAHASVAVARNSALNLIGLGLPLVIAVFAIPPLFDGLGPDRFGLLGMIWVALAYLNLLDLGLGRATTRFAAPAIRDRDEGALGSILGAAAGLQLVLGVAGGMAVAALAPSLVRRTLELAPALEREAVASFVLLGLATPLLTLTSSLRGVLEAGQRFALINAVRVPLGAANFLVPLVGVWLRWGLPTMVAGLLIVRALALLAFWAACRRAWPGITRRLRVARERLRQLLAFGGWVTLSSVVAALLVYVDRFVIAGVESVEAAGYYTVPHEIVTRLEILPAALVLTLFPMFAALEPTDAGRRSGGLLFDRSLLFMMALVAAPLLVLVAVGGDVLTLWLGREFAAQATGALRLLALGMIANAAAYIPYAAIQASGRPDVTARVQLAELPVYALVLWLCVARWGIVGAAAAWALRVLADALILHVIARRMGLTSRGRAPRRARLAVALVVYAAALLAAGTLITAPAGAVAVAATLLAAWLLWCWAFLLEPAERATMRLALTRPRAVG